MEHYVFDLRREVKKLNREMLHRIRTAGAYQRKAIRALFPEEMGGHLDVIENEMKAMLLEVAAEWIKDCGKESTVKTEKKSENSSKAKKVDIS